MFYLVTPYETMYSSIEYVPRLVVEVSQPVTNWCPEECAS